MWNFGICHLLVWFYTSGWICNTWLKILIAFLRLFWECKMPLKCFLSISVPSGLRNHCVQSLIRYVRLFVCLSVGLYVCTREPQTPKLTMTSDLNCLKLFWCQNYDPFLSCCEQFEHAFWVLGLLWLFLTILTYMA